MISSLKMAHLSLIRQKTISFILIFSLAISAAGAGVLMQLIWTASEKYHQIPKNFDAIVGPKKGGIDILLDSIGGNPIETSDISEDDSQNFLNAQFLPSNLYETLKSSIPVSFQDGTTVDASHFITKIIPLLKVGSWNGLNIFGTNESFIQALNNSGSINFDSSTNNSAVVGSMIAREFHLNVGNQINFKSLSGEKLFLTISAILPSQYNSFDLGIYCSLPYAQSLLGYKNPIHPVWKNKILSYFLIQMDHRGFSALSTLINDRTVSEIIWVPSEMRHLHEITGAASHIGQLILAIILTLAGFSIFAVITLRQMSQKLSHAILQAIGFQKAYILKWFLWESVIIGSIAGICAWIMFKIMTFNIINFGDKLWDLVWSQSKGFDQFVLIVGGTILFSITAEFISTWALFKNDIQKELKTG